MKRKLAWKLAITLGAALVLAGGLMPLAGQAEDPQAAPQVTDEQQKQLERLKQLEEQREKQRDALEAAIADFGWDSDEADEAREGLFRSCAESRKLRRELRQSGVATPPPAGFGRRGYYGRGDDVGPDRPWAGRGWGRGHPRRGHGGRGGWGCPWGARY